MSFTIRRWSFWLAGGWIAFTLGVGSVRGAEEPEIVVAIRYLENKGQSHSHPYLYRGDGQLLRQLTRSESGQDHEQVFKPDGTAIIFRHQTARGVRQFWSVKPNGGGLHRLSAAPDWYVQTKSSAHFDSMSSEMTSDTKDAEAAAEAAASTVPTDGNGTPHYRAPDGSAELVLSCSTDDTHNDANDLLGSAYVLRDLTTGKASKLSELPGFQELQYPLVCPNRGTYRYFLLDGALRVIFFYNHLNSTDGTTVLALDLAGKRIVRLSPNWATPFPLPGEEGFLTRTEERYVPFGDGTHTANCSYIDSWDAGLRKVRYARQNTPAICYGASMVRPGKRPRTVTILEPVPLED